MVVPNESGTSHETVDSAAQVFEGLLSATETEERDPAETPTEPELEGADPESEESNDTEQNDSEEEPVEGEEETEEEAPQPRKFKVKADGQDLEVTEDELLNGYSRTADYTRKTQKHAETVKAFETEQVAVRAERQRLAENLVQLEQALQQVAPEEPDWDKLRTENPNEYPAVYTDWQRHKEKMAFIAEKRKEAVEKVVADQRAQHATYLEGERAKLLEVMPEWKNADVAKKEKAEMTTFAKSLGFSDEDLGAVTNHRLLVLLKKAMLYDKAEKAKPALRQRLETLKTATPGAPAAERGKKMTEQTKRALKLRKTGRQADAARLIETMLD